MGAEDEGAPLMDSLKERQVLYEVEKGRYIAVGLKPWLEEYLEFPVLQERCTWNEVQLRALHEKLGDECWAKFNVAWVAGTKDRSKYGTKGRSQRLSKNSINHNTIYGKKQKLNSV
ncbi:hypothetical protein DUNSADRAFT_9393 [Dunaliella salina]|uniref:Uncharacterized protein n=1 Tax=Dunaliella salina TaxID=3046 RepID=A0ABQ7GHK9_DUNSA|nr:hypothetical protein DUNSADRAFT_9393 [Dunaliella salina]|eukprot:KAF5834079.1 hypothetical protein DUNSADRAFT_9393 [Dunaliella salina]